MGATAKMLEHPSLINNATFMDKVSIKRIIYVSDDIPVNGYLLEPRAPGKYPAIIFNRGGYGEFGALGPNLKLLQLADLAADGYVIVASQYRGTGGAPGHDEFGGVEVADVLNLIPLLESLDNVDASRIGMMGQSRGGMMTYLALTRTSRIKTAVVIAGAADLEALIRDRPKMNRVFQKAFPVDAEAMPAELQKRSAVLWADKLPRRVPMLIMHGSADWRVSPHDSLVMASRLLQNGAPCRLILFEGGDHSLSQHSAEMSQQIHDWFRRFLLEDAAPSTLVLQGH